MAKSYNVNREVNDAFYRYKMPAIVAKVEGKGNGIKTVIVNMIDIARSLNREPIYPTKYFGIELGAQTHIDNTNERYIVNGSHDDAKLQDILDGYIKKFVLCQKCENPETKLTVRSKGIIQICQACGYKGELRNAAHALANYIQKQHKIEKETNKKDKKAKNGEKKAKTTQDIYEKDRTEVKVKNGSKFSKGDEWEGDGNWSDSEDELENKVKNLDLKDMKPEDMTNEQRGEAFEQYIDDLIESNTLVTMMKAKEKIMDIVMKADYYGVKSKGNLVLFDKLLEKNFVTGLKTYRFLFIMMNHTMIDNEPEDKAMKNTMSAVDYYFGKFQDEVSVDKCAHFVKFLYDFDIVDDEHIIEWGEAKASKRYCSREMSAALKEKSAKVIEWLKTAEEETESEEESEDDEIEFDGAANEGEIKKVEPAAAKVAVEEVKAVEVVNEETGEAEEIDIDDI